ncbi:Uncharacterised protein [Mycobacteroides abscessus subsp. massiliense]|nr:Uncharacterised protein [Mycobacteroides abscessus subsp. massiliense]SKZ08022.1 Uncharacterised protein [Mycobacteroides abscessus subsp. massiliense]
MRYSEKGWIGLVVYIAAVEYFAPEDEKLSHQFDRWLSSRLGWAICHAAVAITGLHLLNYLSERVDPYTGFGRK